MQNRQKNTLIHTPVRYTSTPTLKAKGNKEHRTAKSKEVRTKWYGLVSTSCSRKDRQKNAVSQLFGFTRKHSNTYFRHTLGLPLLCLFVVTQKNEKTKRREETEIKKREKREEASNAD